MAAWIAVGLVGGLWIGYFVAMWVLDGRQSRSREVLDLLEQANRQQPGDKEMLERVLERLLGAVVPEPREERAELPPTTQSEAEYEPPAPEVGDWTDPFFALGSERQMVGRLAPGQGVPVGVQGDADGEGESSVEAWRERGEGAFEEWMRETVLPESEPVGSWVDPVRLEDE